ncbi:MAG: DUF305 domain-containing protein [Candidatus Eremiobacteraeota bacterium]|nr:DUF305 domain-containing protein [Candidatus Eremiobacteraeota bacterium]MCW5870094.1 DUF305 domain-containing protein [Candidatus Eremiobacteraeota bacterium]
MKDIFCGGALLLALVGYGCSTPSDNTQITASSSPAAVTTETSLSQDERLYLQAMAEHQKLGVSLAQDAQRQARDKALKQLADRLLTDYNTRLRKLEGLGAVAPDGRENPEQEKRSLGSPRSSPPGSQPASSVQVGPGVVVAGEGSYDARWLKTFRRHNENGVRLAGNLEAKLRNQGLLQWNRDMISSEKAELAELQALSVL